MLSSSGQKKGDKVLQNVRFPPHPIRDENTATLFPWGTHQKKPPPTPPHFGHCEVTFVSAHFGHP